MIASNACVKHTLLALSADYWLHFNKDENILNRANSHYQQAQVLLSAEIKSPNSTKVGKDHGIIAAMLLLFIDNAVNYELRGDKYVEPRWLSGAHTACWILKQSDPGQRYWNNTNVQCTAPRTSNTNYVVFIDILAQTVSSLKVEDTDQLYSFLLQGTENEARQIHGGTGLCPKLLHILAQITSLCARMSMQLKSNILPYGGAAMLEMLTNFRQSSNLSQGYPTTEALLRSCSLSDDRKVGDKN